MFVRKELIVNRPPPDPDAGRFKNFSLAQWVVIIALDVVMRVTYLSVLTGALVFSLMLLPINMKLSLFHIVLLFPITFLVSRLRLRPIPALAAIFLPTNILFFSTVIWISLYEHKIGRVTSCVDNECRWVDGTITWSGVWNLACLESLHLAINVLPLLLVWIYRNWHERSKSERMSA
jgi:hypothetical protein